MVSLATIVDIAKVKGLKFFFDEAMGSYVVKDKSSDLLMAEYANVTVQLMTERAWREEFNKLRPSSYT